jgi:hypothetical protein
MDVIDLGNDKAVTINDDCLARSRQTTNVYAIAYCSGDGEFMVDCPVIGNRPDRVAKLEELIPDFGQPGSRWAFCQWSPRLQGWGETHASDGEMERKFRDWLRLNKPPADMRR